MPVDEFDEACRNLHWGYQCAGIESIDNYEETCEAWGIDYHPVEVAEFGTDVVRECTAANREHVSGNVFCAVQACIVETRFVMHLDELQFYELSPEYQHSHQGWPTTHNQQCVARGSASGSISAIAGFRAEAVSHSLGATDHGEMKCCGEYPHKKPFNTAHKGCCNGNTFLSAIYQCCEDGSSRISCLNER